MEKKQKQKQKYGSKAFLLLLSLFPMVITAIIAIHNRENTFELVIPIISLLEIMFVSNKIISLYEKGKL